MALLTIMIYFYIIQSEFPVSWYSTTENDTWNIWVVFTFSPKLHLESSVSIFCSYAERCDPDPDQAVIKPQRNVTAALMEVRAQQVFNSFNLVTYLTY